MSSNDSESDTTTTISTHELPKEPKRRLWSAAEDATLRDYINKNGEGDWKNVANKCRLNRSVRSCIARWKYYLSPNLKKEKLTLDEQDTIFRLHATHGNKWSLIAKELPGRSNHEIQYFYNCHIKKFEKKEQRGMSIGQPPQQTINHAYNNNNNNSSLYSGIMAKHYHFPAPAANLARDSEPNPMLLSSQERKTEIDKDWEAFFEEILEQDHLDRKEWENFLDNRLLGFMKPPQDKDDKM